MSVQEQLNDSWALKEFTRPDCPVIAYFRKNESPSIAPGDPAYPFQVYLTLKYTPKDESGLPSVTDTELLYSFEERVFAQMEHDLLAVMVATVVQSGVKDHLFYTRDPGEFSRRADLLMAEVARFSPACEVQRDAAWSVYNDFP